MKAQHSKSLLATWRIAEMEASRLGATELEPVHLLIGLAKAADIDWVDAIDKEEPDREALLEELLRETRKLRVLFKNAGLDPKKTRRGLRRALAGGRGRGDEERLRRSETGRKVFGEAEKLAALEGSQVYPRHLLQAIGAADDPELKEKVTKAGIEEVSLERLAKLPTPTDKGSQKRIAWN